MPTRGACAVILNDRNEVLLILREDIRRWGLPGGGLEPGESFEQAAVREVREETGYEVALERLSGIYRRPQYPGGDVTHVFVGHVVGGDGSEHDWEAVDVRWFPLDALPRRMWRFGREHVADAVSGTDAVLGTDAAARGESTPIEKEQRLPALQAALLHGFLVLRRWRNRLRSLRRRGT